MHNLTFMRCLGPLVVAWLRPPCRATPARLRHPFRPPCLGRRYSSVVFGSSCSHADTTSGTELSCYKVYYKAFPLQPRHWLNITRECSILKSLRDDRCGLCCADVFVCLSASTLALRCCLPVALAAALDGSLGADTHLPCLPAGLLTPV